jgi:NAD(P)-dependent dehydrogenase (short-subunit alcohol dehydrogenase family)
VPELAKKVAFVTGASRAIGRSIALTLANEGAQVVLTGRDMEGLGETARLIQESSQYSGASPHIARLDQVDATSIDAAVKSTMDKFGQIDILVNNSGITGKSAALWDLSEDDWDETMDTNLKGAFLVSKAIIPSMISRKSGSIVFIGSVTGKRPLVHRSVYAASKLGMLGMVRTLAAELGPHGIRANLISPGYVDGIRLEWVIEQVAAIEKLTPVQMREKWLQLVPLGKFVQPEDIAQGVLFLGSERAAAITGIDLNISGGLVMY